MPDIAHTEELRGHTIEIIQDPDCASPLDGAVRFVVLHSRYSNPASGLTTVDDVAVFEAENAAPGAPWFTIPLWLYDHSGTVYRVGATNPFSCRWDSGRVGIVALKRSEFGEGADLPAAAAQVAETYTAWANGECYGYVVKDAAGEEVDSCWGFVGAPDGYVLEQARENVPDLAVLSEDYAAAFTLS